MSKKNQGIAVVNQEVVQEAHWQGPLPPPAALEAFKQLVPDAPERIIAMAEEEGRVRREQMQKDHDSENRTKETDVREFHKDVCRGQFMAFATLLLIIGSAVYCASHGHDGVAIALASMGAVGIVSNFIWNKKK